jgi:hypothetical protein
MRPRIVDAWIPHPTPAFLGHPMFETPAEMAGAMRRLAFIMRSRRKAYVPSTDSD